MFLKFLIYNNFNALGEKLLQPQIDVRIAATPYKA